MAQQKGISYEDIVRDVRAGKVAPIYYLMGDEPYYIDKVSDFIVDAVLKPDEKDFNLDIVYGADVTLNQVIELARAYPMMAQRRVVLVREAQAIRPPPDTLNRAHPVPQERHARQTEGCGQGHTAGGRHLREPAPV